MMIWSSCPCWRDSVAAGTQDLSVWHPRGMEDWRAGAFISITGARKQLFSHFGGPLRKRMGVGNSSPGPVLLTVSLL